MHRYLRRLAIHILRAELEEREASARLLATEAYRQSATGKAGRAGRAWWDGYARGIKAILEGEQL